VLDDPYASKRHLRIYTVVYDDDDGNDRDTLVYAEDLSANGTYWNGALIGKGNGGFLLCNDDVLRLSRNTYFTFNCLPSSSNGSAFDLTQEREMGVCCKWTLHEKIG
jgi:protein-serine/threonine kinase